MNDHFFTRSPGPARYTHGPRSKSRFVEQSHALGAPRASPFSLAIAAAVAIALYWISRQLVE